MVVRERHSVQIPDQLILRLEKSLDSKIVHELGKVPPEAVPDIKELESLAQAFLFLKPDSWMGVLNRVQQETFHDSPHEIRLALDTLSSIAHYWSRYVSEWRNGRPHYELHRSVLEISPANKINIVQDLRVVQESVKELKRGRGKQYSAYIMQTGWLGDGDFWGSMDSPIFPMTVIVSGPAHTYYKVVALVTDEQLGIPFDLALSAWKSWSQHRQALFGQQHQLVMELYGKRLVLPYVARKAIRELLQEAKEIGEEPVITLHDIASRMQKDWGGDVPVSDWTRTSNIFRENLLNRIASDGDKSPTLIAATQVAADLHKMLSLATRSQSTA